MVENVNLRIENVNQRVDFKRGLEILKMLRERGDEDSNMCRFDTKTQ